MSMAFVTHQVGSQRHGVEFGLHLEAASSKRCDRSFLLDRLRSLELEFIAEVRSSADWTLALRDAVRRLRMPLGKSVLHRLSAGGGERGDWELRRLSEKVKRACWMCS